MHCTRGLIYLVWHAIKREAGILMSILNLILWINTTERIKCGNAIYSIMPIGKGTNIAPV